MISEQAGKSVYQGDSRGGNQAPIRSDVPRSSYPSDAKSALRTRRDGAPVAMNF